MKYIFLGIICLFSFVVEAFEYEVQVDNDRVSVVKAKIMPFEEIGLHRDEYPQIVIALKGGIITRIEADGTTTDVNFPTGFAVLRGADPEDVFHRSVNKSDQTIELMIIQLKTDFYSDHKQKQN